jgi:hypothetical protein
VYDQPTTLLFDNIYWWPFGFAGGGSSSMGVVMMDAEMIGMGEHADAPLAMPYPNPTADRVRIPLRTARSVNSVELLGAEGTIVRTFSDKAVCNGQLELDVHDLSRGTYLARLLFTDGTSTTFRMVLSR